MRRSALAFASSLVALVFGAACSAPDSVSGVKSDRVSVFGVGPGSDVVATDDYWLHLVGAGVMGCDTFVWDCYTDVPDITIEALRKFDGTVNGWVHLPRAQGSCMFYDGCPNGELKEWYYPRDLPVVEIVAPTATNDLWCIEAEIDYIENWHLLLWVRDLGDGKTAFDQLAVGGGPIPENTCANYPSPSYVGAEWTPLVSGDYKGMMKVK